MIACLMGHPVAHSLSPKIHNEAAKRLGIDLTYVAFDITREILSKAVDGIKVLGFRGANLTMPLKEDVIPLLDKLSDEAKAAHSVNTIVNDGGKLTGHTTDGKGFFDSMRYHGFDVKGKTITVIGGGGAAKAIITRARFEGAGKVNVFMRKDKSLYDKEALSEAIAKSELLVNATNVGMGDDRSSLVDPDFLRPGMYVADIIYNPRRTTLLKDAEKKGCRICPGIGMLIFQAAASFKLWTGKDMSEDLIKEYMESENEL